MLELRGVTAGYGNQLVLRDVDLVVPDHSVVALLGPNGAGKSTLMNLMTGLLKPSRGAISILGTSPDRPDELFQKVGYCGGFDSFPPGVTGAEFISMYLSVHGVSRSRIEELTLKALERVGLLEAGNRKVAAYSKGMRQRVRLAQSIAHEPSVLILDEPLNGLDPMARAETIDLFRTIAREGLHLIISSHILHELSQFCTRIGIIEAGQLVAQGDVKEIYRTLGVQRLVHVQLTNRSDGLVAGIKAIPGVATVELDTDRIAIRIREDELAVEELLERIHALGARIQMFQPEAMDMETAFMKLTQGRVA